MTSAELDPVPSDDPDTEPVGDPTATPVFLTPDVGIDDVTVTEGDPPTAVDAIFTVALTEASNRPVTVTYQASDGTALAGEDYQGATGEVVFAPGETSRSVTVPVLPDLTDEPDETFTVRLTAADGGVVADGEGLGTILDDDPPPDVAVTGVTVTEGESGTVDAVFSVTLSAVSSFDVTVGYQTVDGTATGGLDYQATAGTVMIPAGSLTAAITVPVIGDRIDEPDETFTVQLTSVQNGVLAVPPVATGTIVDDDPPPVLSVTDVTVTEGPGVEAVFTLTLSAESGFDITAAYATADGSALASADYTAVTGTVSLPAGTTSTTIAVPVADDGLDEDDETFLLTLTNPTHVALPDGPAVGTVLDDDAPPTITIDDITVTEGTGGTVEALFTLALSGPSGREIRVTYQTVDGGGAGLPAALSGLDYTPTSGTVALPAGTTTQKVSVTVAGDALDEPDETFTVLLSSPVNVDIADGEGVGTIVDDDEPPTVVIDDVTVTEGDSGTVEAVFTLTLSAPSGFDISLAYATADVEAQAGIDYTAASGTLLLPAGMTAAEVTVSVLSDLEDELDETYTVALSNPQHVVLDEGIGLGTILDDDEARISIDDVTVEEGDSATTDAVFTVTLATLADREIRVDYTTASETATAGVDYLPAGGTLVFPAGTTGQTLAVSVVGDLILEDDETFWVELSNAVETRIEDGVGFGTIIDDEECPGPNLLENPGAELREVDGTFAGWTLLNGDWHRRFGSPEPVEGRVSFAAGEAAFSELFQDVEVNAYATRLATGTQEFVFDGFVRTFDEIPPDVVRIVVEYRDTNNLAVLDTFDSGEITSPLDWTRVTDVRAAPVGTGWVRVRLLATRFAGTEINGFVDALSLRSLRAPTIALDDVTVFEGDSGTSDAAFTVTLACPYESHVSVSYLTADATAVAAEDYLPIGGSLFFPVGTTAQTIAVPVVGDEVLESTETFLVELSNLASAGRPVLLDPLGVGTILGDDFCPRSHGFWKNHTDEWPVAWILMGGMEYEADEMLEFLESKSSDATYILALQLVATKLNLARGSDPFTLPTVEAADAFLELYLPGSDPRGAARDEALRLKDELDAYNNLPCDDDGGSGGGGGNGNGDGNGNGKG